MELYHTMRTEHGPEAARGLVRKILEQHCDNVSRAASILGCSRLCVRRARDGPLQDASRTPKTQPRKIETTLEKLCLKERKATGYGRRRLSLHIALKYGIAVSENTLKRVLRRGNVRYNRYRRSSKAPKPIYDYAALLPFEEGQIDTKYIEDYGALGPMVFRLRRYGLPLYQWTYSDAKTKTRFLAYSHNLGREYGTLFVTLIGLWLRSCGVATAAHLQQDGGGEWLQPDDPQCGEILQQLREFWQVTVRTIPTGKKWLQGIVERSHRTDDEEFYRPHLEKIASCSVFLRKAQQWQDTWNGMRQHWGHGMEGRTPLQKLAESDILVPEKILLFPVLLLDDVLRVVRGGNYLCTHYLLEGSLFSSSFCYNGQRPRKSAITGGLIHHFDKAILYYYTSQVWNSSFQH